MGMTVLMQMLMTFGRTFLKDFLGTILLGMVKDSFFMITGKIEWRIVVERFLTRVLVLILRWVKGLSSNTLVNSTVEDLLAQMRAHGLAQAYDDTLKKPD